MSKLISYLAALAFSLAMLGWFAMNLLFGVAIVKAFFSMIGSVFSWLLSGF